MKQNIVLGADVKLNLETLLRSRLLIQANSGGGKSWCIRRIAEQAFGKIPIIIVDPEGEFATLREKFGFVLVGKGGETPADVRSAALVAHRLLEVKASAVCDIFELSPFNRHVWVKTFLQAMIDAPKELWHPTLVVVDEAHTFAPEKGAGESDASEAMISLATKGRKRGFCAIFATQRISKLRKDAAAELHNNLIGKCFIDQDRKRAAEQLGIEHKQFREFSEKMKLLPQGVFLAQGVAISTEIVEFKVGTVETTHPDINTKQSSLVVPPAPEEIKHLLPKLADLPKAAEEKAKTESDLRSEIRSLKAQLVVAAKSTPVQIADGRAIERAVAAATKGKEQEILQLQRHAEKLRKSLVDISVMAAKGASIAAPEIAAPVVVPSNNGAARRVTVPLVTRPTRAAQTIGEQGQLTGPEQKILKAMGELLSIGKDAPPTEMVAAWSGYSPNGGAFGNPTSSLRTKGLIDRPQPGIIVLTEDGRRIVGNCEPPDAQELMRRIESICTGPEWKILNQLIEYGPEDITTEDLATRSGYSPLGGAFGNPTSALRTKGLLDRPRPGVIRAASWLMESLQLV